MKMRLSVWVVYAQGAWTAKVVCTLDEVRPFLSLIVRRRFVMMPSELHRLWMWLREQGVEEAVMESTDSFRMPMICSSLTRLLRATLPPGPGRAILNGRSHISTGLIFGGRSYPPHPTISCDNTHE